MQQPASLYPAVEKPGVRLPRAQFPGFPCRISKGQEVRSVTTSIAIGASRLVIGTGLDFRLGEDSGSVPRRFHRQDQSGVLRRKRGTGAKANHRSWLLLSVG